MKAVTDTKYYDEIAKTLQRFTGHDISYTPDMMTGGIIDVQQKASIDGKEEGIRQGRQDRYNEFWDAIQKNGESVNYQYAFGGGRWSDATFKPKYDLKGTSFYRCFHSSEIKTIDKVIDASKATAVGQMFYNAAIENITHLIMPNLTSYSQMFQTCTALKNITVSGIIGASIDFSDSSKLTPSSVDSIIGTLKQLAEGDDARTVTFHKTVKNNMTDSQKAIIQEKGWTLA